MPFGERLRKLFGHDDQPPADPHAFREAGIVLVTKGPAMLDRLREAGIEAMGVETFDPATGVQTHMRVMVLASDLEAARRMMAEPLGDEASGEAVDAMDEDDEADPEAEAASQAAMSRLYVAADRLAGRPADERLRDEVAALGDDVAGGPPPFGVEPLAWERVGVLAAAVAGAGDDEEAVRRAATALRDFLRSYV